VGLGHLSRNNLGSSATAHLEFKATNNMAEYEALIFGSSAALSQGIHQLLVKGNSQLIIK
jgi:ribonuclease HI